MERFSVRKGSARAEHIKIGRSLEIRNNERDGLRGGGGASVEK